MISVEFFNIKNKFFYNLQKLIAFFVLIVILLNNFIPKTQEFKADFIAALSCNVKIIQTNFYEKYLDMEMSVINSVLNVFDNEEVQVTKLTKNQNEKENSKDNQTQPINTSADNGILTENNTNNQSEINVLKAKSINAIYSFSNKDLNIMYGNLKINCNFLLNDIGILFFILFSILVVRIKDTIAVVLNNNI